MKRALDLILSLAKSQAAAAVATIVDFGVLAGLVEVFGVSYLGAVALGALSGAATHFLLGRHWAFEASGGHTGRQATRYAAVSAGSLGLNTVGVWALTAGIGAHYLLSKTVVALLVGVGYNFPLHRGFVFGKSRSR